MKPEVIRIATAKDTLLLSALVNSAYRGESSRNGWTTEADLLGGQRTDPDSLRATIAVSGNIILLLHAMDELIGCVFLQNKGDRAYLGMLTVKPTLQAGGHGKQLMTYAEDFIKTQWKFDIVEMTVIQKRAELIAWYERRGYRRTERTEPFPYGDAKYGLPKVDDLEFAVLEKKLV